MKNEKKYSILTVNFGGYEKIKDPVIVRDDVEYVCVTDDENLKSDVWKIIYKPGMWFLYPKHHPFEFVSTDVCLWLDGSYKIIGDPTDNFVLPFINSEKELAISLHNERHNIFEELWWWVATRGLSITNGYKFIVKLINEGFNSDTLFQTSCILLKKTDLTKNIYETLCDVEQECSVDGNYRDDQTLFSYSIVKNAYRSDKILLMDFSHTSNNSSFIWCFHGSDVANIVIQKSKRCFDEEQQLLYCIR